MVPQPVGWVHEKALPDGRWRLGSRSMLDRLDRHVRYFEPELMATVLCAVANSIELLILARALQAAGGSGAIVVVRAIVRDLYSGARAGRELSMMGTIMALAPIIAPLIGGALHAGFGWRANFLVATVVGVTAGVIVARSLPETLRTRSPDPISLASILNG